jgi:O-antigen/teichoic acid export membrane protein
LSLLKKLAGQTAVYGLSSIIGRLLNYLLVPLYTRIFLTDEYGIVTELYAYVAFLIVILTYGLETALFNFSRSEPDKEKVYSTILTSILSSSAVFAVVFIILAPQLADSMGYSGNPEYIEWFVIIIALDAISGIPYAKLREQNKAAKFALFKIINILTNIGFNLFFLVFAPWVLKNESGFLFSMVDAVYDPGVGIGYIFISNLISSIVTILLLLPYFIPKVFVFDFELWKKIMIYSMPLMLAGLAGVTNEFADRLLLKYLLPPDIALHQLGIYGACYKISILMSIFIQAFRFAAEPFFFAQYHEKSKTDIYAQVMNYFVIAGSLIFLSIMFYIDIVQFFVGEAFREGLPIVPILLVANLLLGIFFNLSIWYKLTGKTMLGAYISGLGAAITILFNLLLIPRMGYMGAAWTTLICYLVMTIFSYYLGQKHFPVNYNLKKIGFYLGLSLLLFWISTLIAFESQTIRLGINTVMLIGFMIGVFLIERPKKILI